MIPTVSVELSSWFKEAYPPEFDGRALFLLRGPLPNRLEVETSAHPGAGAESVVHVCPFFRFPLTMAGLFSNTVLWQITFLPARCSLLRRS